VRHAPPRATGRASTRPRTLGRRVSAPPHAPPKTPLGGRRGVTTPPKRRDRACVVSQCHSVCIS
jgi:hypothetical protein